ncbi:P-loop NTPase [Amphidinium carterae]|mmetsp:Transcript_3603/g.9071  ORF Transcript_3603/g.9071 Transcript_3603/m.9071 type:complete len:393 (-) Transcript_3603:79-1257(-)
MLTPHIVGSLPLAAPRSASSTAPVRDCIRRINVAPQAGPAPCVSVAEILKASTLVGAAGFVAAERVRNSRAGNQQRRVTLIGATRRAQADSEAEGADGGSDKAAVPEQPPPERMPPPASLDKVKSIVAVSSCKGGVGKSSVAVNLAFELRKRGAEVGIFDCDVYGPSLPVMVALEDERPKLEIYADEEDKKHIRPLIHPETGIKLVSFGYLGGAAVMRGLMVTGLIQQLLAQTDWGELDYLILDMPPGTGDIHLALTQTCEVTAAVIVTMPQKLSTTDVEKGIEMFDKLDVPSVAVVQNMSYLPGPAGQKMYPFGETTAAKDIAERFGIKHAFEMPMDAAVSKGGDSGVPFIITDGDGAPAKVIAELATAVETEVDALLAEKEAPSLQPQPA